MAVVLAMLLITPAMVLFTTSAANAAVFPPRYVRTIGGAGRPGVFSWGVQYNPVTNEMLVSDYLNFKIRRYDLQGNHLGDFWRENHVGQPYTVAVDHQDGSIYVAELKDNPLTVAIAKYDAQGNFLSSIPVRLAVGPRGEPPTTPQTSIRAFYTVWMTVEEDTGDLFVLDSHYNITDDYRPYVLQLDWIDPTTPGDTTAEVMVQNWWELNPPTLPDPCNNPGTCVPRAYGIDIADDDTIWLTDAQNQIGYRYAKDGTFLSTFGAGELGGDNRGVVVNEALDRVYVVDAQNSEIDVFNQAGAYITSFSSEGTGPGQFSGGGRAIDIDPAGNVWVGDFGGFETEKFSPTGTPLLSAPQPPRKPQPGLLGQPRDVAVDDVTGEVWVADTWNQRIVRFSATGVQLGAYGQRGPGGPFDMNYPRSIAIDPDTRRIWVAQERGHHIQVYDYPTSPTAAPTYVRQIGLIGADDIDPGHFRWPVDIEFYTQPGGRRVAIIGDRMAASVKMFDADTYQEITKPVDPDPSDPENPLIPVSNHGTAVDPATGNIYVMRNSRVEVYDQNGDPANVVFDGTNRFGSSGSGAGQMRGLVDAVISDNVLYVSDETLSRVSAFTLDGQFLGRWGSTYGANIYDFKGSVGIDADANGLLYVTDTANDRIQVFNPDLGRQYEQIAPPVPVVTTPAQSVNVPLNPVTLSGTATDDVAVGFVEIALQDYTTGKWWNALNQSWEDTKTFANAAWSGADATSVQWRWVFLGVSTGGRYLAEIRTRDHNANFSQSTMRSFAMPGATPPPVPDAPVADNVRPTALQSSPTEGEIVLTGSPITFTGTASDDVGIGRVRIAIRNLANGRYLSNPDSSSSNSFSTSFVWQEATLSTPGEPTTEWSFTWNTPIATGCTCQTLIETRDTSDNINGFKPQVNFTVATALPPPLIEPPVQVAELGGPLHAEFYTSGLEAAPDGTLVIADTGNNQVAKYDAAGNELWRVGGPGSGDNQFLRPRDVSVADDGTIFVVDTENERIVRLGADGTWLGELNTPARFFLGGTFEGNLFYLADIQRAVRVFDVAGNQVNIIEEVPDTVCSDLFDIRDAAADSAGNVYVANYRQNAITVFSPSGECLYSFGSTGTGDGQFRTPYGVSTGFDPVTGRELVYVADAQNSRVQVFELDGTFVGKFGVAGDPDRPGTLTTLRRVSVATDGSGDVWVADLWGWRAERWARTPSGWEYAQTIGSALPEPTDDAVFHEPRGLVVDGAGVVTVMDSIHHRLVLMNLDGTLIDACGRRGDGNGEYNWPRDLAIDEATGDLWTVDTKKNRIQILRPDCSWLASRGSAGSDVGQFNWPRAIEIRQSDGTAWIADTQNHRVVVWDVATRTAVGQFGTGNPGNLANQLNRPMGIAVDEATGHIFVADTINNRIVELSADPGGTNIQLVRTIAYGFDQPEAIDIGPDGRIYVADTADSEVVILGSGGTWLATFGATEGLDHPAGIAVMPSGDVLVSDSFNDRILVYSNDPDWQPPVPDVVDPDGTLDSPTQDQVLTTAPVTFAGNATDDVSVTNVRVAIRRTSDQLWWNGSTWQASAVNFEATLTAPGTTTTAWSYAWTPPAADSYAVQVSAVDGAGNVDESKPYVRFSYTDGVADSANPNGLVSKPSNDEVFSSAPIDIDGTATDDVGVTNVRVELRNVASGLYWNGTAWQAISVPLEATLATPMGTSTTWSLPFSPPAAGQFSIRVTAVDAAGKVDPTRPFVRFSYSPPATDTSAPNGTISTPGPNAILPLASVNFAGAATDDVGVAEVQVAIRNTTTSRWWNGSGWQTAFASFATTLSAPGAPSSDWTYQWTPPSTGNYAVQVLAADAAGNVDPTKPWRTFQIQ
jgi:DNA-binding beta-propeller fold protein YncE